MKSRVIESVIVIHQNMEGPEFFQIGGKVNGKKIADIIKRDNTIWVFDEEDEIVAEIINCPVIVIYRDAENE